MKRLNCAKIRLLLILFMASIVLSGGNANADYTFGIPLNLGPKVNSPAHDDSPSITADGLELYFMSYRLRGHPDGDIYVSTRETTQDPWGVSVNLGPTVNTSSGEFFPCISADGLELYFLSGRPVPPDGGGIWISKRAYEGSSINFGPFLLDPSYLRHNI